MTGPDSEGLQAGYLDSEFAAEALATIVLYGMDNDRPPAEVAANVLAHLKMHLPSSPVVPSVGAVPVEVPDGGYGSDADQAMFRRAFDEAGLAPTLAAWKSAALIAARVRAEADRGAEQVISERDEYHEWADRLAAALGGDAIGEHSSGNNPWQNALDLAAERDARVRAEDGGAESKAWHKRRLIEFAQAVDSRVGSVHLTNTLNESERVWLARAAVGLAREVLDGDCAAPNEWVEVVRAEERQRIAAEIRTYAGPLTSEGVYVGVSTWPADRAAGYTAAIDEILEEVIEPAVPVATPDTVQASAAGLESEPVGSSLLDPVATPTEPVDKPEPAGHCCDIARFAEVPSAVDLLVALQASVARAHAAEQDGQR